MSNYNSRDLFDTITTVSSTLIVCTCICISILFMRGCAVSRTELNNQLIESCMKDKTKNSNFCSYLRCMQDADSSSAEAVCAASFKESK